MRKLKKYIVSIEDIGELTTVAAFQGSKIFLEKDSKSVFYIAHIEDNIEIPDEVKALEMQSAPMEELQSSDKKNKKFLDLRLCIEVPEAIDKRNVEEILCKEISKTLKAISRESQE